MNKNKTASEIKMDLMWEFGVPCNEDSVSYDELPVLVHMAAIVSVAFGFVLLFLL